ncbi:MAG: hypothetical protein ACSLE1_09800 [Sphingobium sp.]
MHLLPRLLGAAAMLRLAIRSAAAAPTKIDVRVIARGAKFLGGYRMRTDHASACILSIRGMCGPMTS